MPLNPTNAGVLADIKTAGPPKHGGWKVIFHDSHSITLYENDKVLHFNDLTAYKSYQNENASFQEANGFRGYESQNKVVDLL